MKKSILQRMTADAENRVDPTQPADNHEALPAGRRSSSPVISNVGRALTQLTKDSVLSLDPDKIERSPFKDRFDNDEEAEAELDALRLSIASEGQKIPVLVRPHPSKNGHLQLAYGYRRLAAIKAIKAASDAPENVRINAYVRELTDRQLIEEQSLENGVRENLTWIEQAMWAVQLKAAGMSHRAICPVLGLSEAAVSHLFRVTDNVPDDVIYAIGRAKGVGRPKWTTLAELLKSKDALAAVRERLQQEDCRAAAGAERMAMATLAASTKKADDRAEVIRDLKLGEQVFARLKVGAAGAVVTIPKTEIEFANWLANRMPDLMHEYRQSSPHRTS